MPLARLFLEPQKTIAISSSPRARQRHDTREAALTAFNKAVLTVPEVEQCHMMASSFDYLLKVRTADIQSYRRVLGEVISALPHVASTSTYVAMEAVKEVF